MPKTHAHMHCEKNVAAAGVAAANKKRNENNATTQWPCHPGAHKLTWQGSTALRKPHNRRKYQVSPGQRRRKAQFSGECRYVHSGYHTIHS